MAKTGDFCARCHAPCSTNGAPPKIGRRYCSARPCQNEKHNADRKRRREAPIRAAGMETVEDRPCSCCGVAMSTRTRRTTDLGEGRWCYRLECQKHKKKYLSAARDSDGIRARNAKTFMDSSPETCPSCGADDAIRPFVHPTPGDEPVMCRGGDDDRAEFRMPVPVSREIAVEKWPRLQIMLDRSEA